MQDIPFKKKFKYRVALIIKCPKTIHLVANRKKNKNPTTFIRSATDFYPTNSSVKSTHIADGKKFLGHLMIKVTLI